LGSYSLTGGLDSAKLLCLRGQIGQHALNFMLDSGATCNFMSATLFRTLKLQFSNELSHQVKLADGAMLKTCGQVACDVRFGTVRYSGVFFVLQSSVPLILGMPFL
jgi:hypothetical protein